MQVVGYDTGLAPLRYDPVTGMRGERGEPALLIAADGEVRHESLASGHELAYTLGRRHCAGEVAGDEHTSCDATGAPYCEAHTDDWPCARCSGNCDKPIPACDEEHAVYLAAFAPDVRKVGVTRLARLPIRLREQGADRAAHLHTVSDGRIARRIERELASVLPERVPVRSKIDGLAATLDEAVWEATLDEYDVIDTYVFEYDLELNEPPVAETLATGTVVGTKGRVLVLRHGAGTYAVDLRDLVGYDVVPEATDRELQVGLGSFEVRSAADPDGRADDRR